MIARADFSCNRIHVRGTYFYDLIVRVFVQFLFLFLVFCPIFHVTHRSFFNLHRRFFSGIEFNSIKLFELERNVSLQWSHHITLYSVQFCWCFILTEPITNGSILFRFGSLRKTGKHGAKGIRVRRKAIPTSERGWSKCICVHSVHMRYRMRNDWSFNNWIMHHMCCMVCRRDRRCFFSCHYFFLIPFTLFVATVVFSFVC